MKCRSCRREITDNSIYCNWCGESQLKVKRRRNVVKVPKPSRLPSGNWHIELRKEQAYFTDPDPTVCTQKALAYRIQWLKDENAGLHKETLYMALTDAIENYIASKSNILSPSTLRSYRSFHEHRFQSCMRWNIFDDTLNWQAAINAEVEHVKPKTLFNAWHLITASFNFAKAPVPDVTLPRVPRAEHKWLTYEQIGTFLEAAKGRPGELAALLALHSLRLSELFALQKADISSEDQTIRIRRSVVLNSDNVLVLKDTNKTESSSRVVPVMIPRLLELVEAAPDGKLITCHENNVYRQINAICRKAGLPEVGVHGLRHSFASLSYHLGWKEKSTEAVGGWINSKIVHEVYTHNADLENDVNAMKQFYTDAVRKAYGKT